MKKLLDSLKANLIFIIPACIIGLIAYVHLKPEAPVKPCLQTRYVVAQVTNREPMHIGKVTMQYEYQYSGKKIREKETMHHSGFPPENFERFYMRVCWRDSADIAFDIITDSIPVKPWHIPGVEYPADSVGIQ